jgi:hypothetical protein
MIYNKQKGNHQIAFAREMDQAKEVLRRLVGITEQFKQEALSKEFMGRFTKIVPPEEMMPQEEQQGGAPIELK